MECIFGLVGDEFALVVADTSQVQSIVVQKTNEDKIMILDSHKLLGVTGESGDRVQFSEYIQKNILLYQYRNGIPLSTSAAANFTRGELATALRKKDFGYKKNEQPSLWKEELRFLYQSWKLPDDEGGVFANAFNPYQVNMMLAGWDKDQGPSLYYLDYISTLHKLEKGGMGYGAYFLLSLMDRYFEKNMSLDKALELVDKCIEEVRSRLVVSPPNFVIKIVDKDGARELLWRRTVEDKQGPPATPIASPMTVS